MVTEIIMSIVIYQSHGLVHSAQTCKCIGIVYDQ